jgi:hypothetical protein
MTDDAPHTPSADELAASLARRVQDIILAAETAATELRGRAATEADLRAAEIRQAAEQDAARLLRRAERDAADYLEDARRRVDAFADGRARRIAQVADHLLVHAEALTTRAQRATRLRHGIDDLVDALAAAAEAIAAEARRAPIDLPPAQDAGAVVTRLGVRPRAVPDPEPDPPPAPLVAAPEPRSPADEARDHVLQVARALPRRPRGRPRPVPPPERPGDDGGDDAA